jgi:segregation and condensation protein A
MYRIKLNEFEGPLDLLLFFIQRDELDIYNIPISKITKDFLEYIQYIQELDLELASEFIIMAATLIQIKAKMMLYKPDEEIAEEEDPRYELVKRLLEYKRYKDASGELASYEEENRHIFSRNDFSGDYRIDHSDDDDPSLQNLTLFNLMKAFKFAMDHRPKEVIHNITRFNVSMEEQIDKILAECEQQEYVSFLNLISSMREKLRIVVTFIAILEMVKNGIIGIRIESSIRDFYIFKLSGVYKLENLETDQYE